jgi:hypothetical protein
MTAKDNLLIYLEKKIISKPEFYKKTGLSNGFLDKSDNINSRNLAKILNSFADLNVEWLLTDRGEMLRKINNYAVNGSNNVTTGDVNNSNIDNRQYYSDSPDVLRAQIEEINRLLEEKECRIREKDEQIKKKDAQIDKLLTLIK